MSNMDDYNFTAPTESCLAEYKASNSTSYKSGDTDHRRKNRNKKTTASFTSSNSGDKYSK
jgi:hypothetical protein